MLTRQPDVVDDLVLHMTDHLMKAQAAGIVIPPDLAGIVPPPAPPIPGAGAPGAAPGAAAAAVPTPGAPGAPAAAHPPKGAAAAGAVPPIANLGATNATTTV